MIFPMMFDPDPSQAAGGIPPTIPDPPLALGSEAATAAKGSTTPVALDEAQMVTRTINGVALQKPLGEWITGGQKHAAGEDSLAQAAKFKQDTVKELANLQEDAEIGRLIRKAQQDDDLGAFEQALVKLNLTPAEAHQAVVDHQATTPSNGPTSPTSTLPADPRIQEQASELAGVKRELEQHRDFLTKRQYEEDLDGLKKTVKGRVDSDDKLAIIVQRTGPRATEVQNMVWEAVQRRIDAANASNGETRLGPAIIDEALAEVRARVEVLGIGTGGGVHRVPGLATMPNVPAEAFHRVDDPKVVSVQDKGRYNASIFEVLRHKLIKNSLDAGG